MKLDEEKLKKNGEIVKNIQKRRNEQEELKKNAIWRAFTG